MPRLILYALIIIGLLTACGGPANTPPPSEAKNPPTVTLNSSIKSGTAPLTVTFTATARPGASETLAYAWDFGDGNTSTGGATRTHTFQEPGSFTTAVTVSGVHGSATATQVISVGAAIEPEPEPEPEPAGPYDGREHLGIWLWAVATSTTESNGYVNFNTFEGSLTADSREAISGSWDDCSFGICVTMGSALMAEIHTDLTGWEHSFAFFNRSGDIRLLGWDLEPWVSDDGTPGYVGIGDYYGAPAGIAIARMGPASASTLSAGFDTLAAQYPDAEWSAPAGLADAFQNLGEATDW